MDPGMDPGEKSKSSMELFPMCLAAGHGGGSLDLIRNGTRETRVQPAKKKMMATGPLEVDPKMGT